MSCLSRVLALVALACIALATPAGATDAASANDPSCKNTRILPDEDNLARVRAATLCLLNVERARHDRAPLVSHDELRKAATSYSRAMVRDRFFDHVSPQGSTLVSRVRKGTTYLKRTVRAWALGENLGWGAGPGCSPQAMVRRWMDSAGHRENILDPRFRNVGIGVARGAPENVGDLPAATYTTDFGYRTS